MFNLSCPKICLHAVDTYSPVLPLHVVALRWYFRCDYIPVLLAIYLLCSIGWRLGCIPPGQGNSAPTNSKNGTETPKCQAEFTLLKDLLPLTLSCHFYSTDRILRLYSANISFEISPNACSPSHRVPLHISVTRFTNLGADIDNCLVYFVKLLCKCHEVSMVCLIEFTFDF